MSARRRDKEHHDVLVVSQVVGEVIVCDRDLVGSDERDAQMIEVGILVGSAYHGSRGAKGI